MTQTALPPRTVHSTPAHWDRFRPAPVLSLHGEDPTSGIPATWHVTPLDLTDPADAADSADPADPADPFDRDDVVGGAYVIERAEGDIHSPQVWMQAQRDARVATETDVIELVRSVMFGR